MSDSWAAMRPWTAECARVVFAVGHAGAGPSMFHSLSQALPPDWQVLALSLPGREKQIAEDPQWSWQDVAQQAAADAAAVLVQRAGASFCLLGQCSGAWLAYVVQQFMTGLLTPGRESAVYVVAQAPWPPRDGEFSLPAKSSAMWSLLIDRGDIPAIIGADAEMRNVLEPSVRADFTALATLPREVEPLSCPIVVIRGAQDDRLAPAELAAWSRFAASMTAFDVPDAGHLVVPDHAQALADILVASESARDAAAFS